MVTLDLVLVTHDSFNYIGNIRENISKLYLSYNHIYIVDDASCQEFIDFLFCFVSTYPNVSLIKNPTCKGPGFCRNLGSSYSSADYLSFLDHDDLLTPFRGLMFDKFISSQCPIFLHYSYTYKRNELAKRSLNHYKSNQRHSLIALLLFIFKTNIVTGSFVIDRSFFKSIGGYPQAFYSEDYAFVIKVLCHSSKIFYWHSLPNQPILFIYSIPFTHSSLSGNHFRMRLGQISNFFSLFRSIPLSKFLILIPAVLLSVSIKLTRVTSLSIASIVIHKCKRLFQ